MSEWSVYQRGGGKALCPHAWLVGALVHFMNPIPPPITSTYVHTSYHHSSLYLYFLLLLESFALQLTYLSPQLRQQVPRNSTLEKPYQLYNRLLVSYRNKQEGIRVCGAMLPLEI